MTNPTNAVEKPATGCECHPAIPAADGRWCEKGMRLWNAVIDAYQRYIGRWPYETGNDELRGIRDYRAAWREFQRHMEASNG